MQVWPGGVMLSCVVCWVRDLVGGLVYLVLSAAAMHVRWQDQCQDVCDAGESCWCDV